MSMLDSFFNKGFKAAKCKTLLKLTIPRIRLLRNRREIQIKQMRRDIAKLLETGQEATARIRVEHIIREEKMMAAQEILELFCELIAVRLPIIEAQRECPLDLKEAISSVCFAAPRCADLPELIQCQMLFAAKYGREFVAAATELMPDCGVNRQLIELLSVRAPPPEDKMKLLKEIAEEHNLDWDQSASEAELFKSHEDLLSGSTQFVSGSKLPLPKEKHDESLYDRPEHAREEEPNSDEGLDTLDFPDVPTVSIRANANAASAPEIISPATAAPVPHSSQEPSKYPLTMEEIYQEKRVKSEEAAWDHQVDHNDGKENNFVGPKEDKQFLPFISPPSLSSESFGPIRSTTSPTPSPDVAAAEHISLPGSLSRTKSETDNVDLGDVLTAAHAAAETAERAAAAARSAASLAQLRISELTRKNSVQVPDSSCENPFHTVNQDQAADARNEEIDRQKSFDGSEYNITSPNTIQFDGDLSGPKSNPSVEAPQFDAAITPSNSFHEHNPSYHQPQRLPSMDEDYMSYPNLFSLHNSFTDKSRSYHDQ